MKETPLNLGTDSTLFGVCTEAVGDVRAGMLVLNSGFLHHIGPFRLHVALGRHLAQAGITTIRLDQSGKGESVARKGMSVDESILADYDDAVVELKKRGAEKVFLVGLCSGADDAFYTARHRPDVAGVILLDGYAARNWRYRLYQYGPKLLNMGAWMRTAVRVVTRLTSSRDDTSSGETISGATIRNWSTQEDMLRGYKEIIASKTRVLAIFTGGVEDYYLYGGQLSDLLGSDSRSDLFTEIHYPDASHTYPIAAHRQRLIAAIGQWVADSLD